MIRRWAWLFVLALVVAIVIGLGALQFAPSSNTATRPLPSALPVPISPLLQAEPTANPSPASTHSPSVSSGRTVTASGAQEEWQPALPIRAAFYYPWYPENWTLRGRFPATRFVPALGFYNSADPFVIRTHISEMEYGQIEAGITSWWGPGTTTDRRMDELLAAAQGTHFRWAVYYEKEGQTDPSVAEIASDLRYLQDHYGRDTGYLRIQGRMVVFVYADSRDRCSQVDRWEKANQVEAYLVLKVFPGYPNCARQPDGWHQYGPDVSHDAQGKFSYSISPGFWRFDSDPAVPRDLDRWRMDIRNMIQSNAEFQLVISFNEWGEGTAVEPAQGWATPSGYGAYLDALHDNGMDSSATGGTKP